MNDRDILLGELEAARARLITATQDVAAATDRLRAFDESRRKVADRTTEHYTAGYKTGISWTFSYRPAGPHVYRGPVAAIRVADEARHRQWMLGFDEGRASRKVVLRRP